MTLKNPEDFHNRLGLIFHGLLALPLAAFIYLFLEIKHRNLQPVFPEGSISDIFIIGLSIIAAGMAGYGFLRFKKERKKLNHLEMGLRNRLEQYFRILIQYYILLGIASVFEVVGLFITTSAVFIFGYVFLLFLLSLNRPNIQKYLNDLRLSKEEKDILIQKQSF